MIMKELSLEELVEINGGETGSRNGARIAGRLVGIALMGPLGGIYYCGKDMGWW
ncbi:hypothetical protein TFKS16_0948 [Tannerella forsythia KS16]|mgnify:FL=1|jgi:hypothetical protein|uniref:Bacteriocin n=2 Tax=Tannerella forsythia TaxID=28112 RepID=G8UJS1_TANFA|nr:hypothetical protein BFO_1290 [Tannerella forsythia 92A2]BAR48694.1 hypothetical protein TF3313_1158 [Tannerella forsythia 3313]BAR51231.1 hypothetical protein TFKS16_0948 [Tannerella forsythia KS16]